MQSFILTLVTFCLYSCLVAAAPQAASRFTLYTLPEPLSGPCDLCEGTDGALWGQDQLANDLFRLDPKTGKIETFEIPFTLAPIAPNYTLPLPEPLNRGALNCVIRPGKDGNIYSAFGTRNQLVRINPKTKKIDVFTPPNLDQPVGNLQPFNDLWSSDTGMWFTQTTSNLVSFFDFKTQKIKSYLVPTPASIPVGMFVDSAGTPWITELVGNKLAKLNIKTGVFTEYPVPLPALAGPAVIRVETENRYIWFTALLGNALGRFDKQTGAFKAYPNPLPGGFVTENTLDSKGNVWYSSIDQNVLSKVDPKTGTTEQFVMPGTVTVSPVSVPLYVTVAVNYGPGNAIWFSQEIPNKVGRFSLD